MTLENAKKERLEMEQESITSSDISSNNALKE